MSEGLLRTAAAEFFEGYCAAFNTRDAAGIAARFSTPSLIVTPEGTAAWHTTDELVTNMSALLARYEEDGFDHVLFDIADVHPIGTGCALVVVSWHMTRVAGLPRQRFHTAYVIRGERERWHIDVCIAYEEAVGGTNRSTPGPQSDGAS